MADRFTTLPILAAIVLIGLVLGFGYTASNFEQLVGLWLLSLLLAFATFVSSLVLLVVCLTRRRWRRSASLAIALTLFVICGLARLELFFQIDRIRFQIFKEHYVGALTNAVSSPGEPTAVRWGLWVHFTTGAIYRLIVRDPLDEILKQRELQSKKMQTLLETKVENLSFCQLSVRHLEGHFYLLTAAC